MKGNTFCNCKVVLSVLKKGRPKLTGENEAFNPMSSYGGEKKKNL